MKKYCTPAAVIILVTLFASLAWGQDNQKPGPSASETRKADGAKNAVASRSPSSTETAQDTKKKNNSTDAETNQAGSTSERGGKKPEGTQGAGSNRTSSGDGGPPQAESSTISTRVSNLDRDQKELKQEVEQLKNSMLTTDTLGSLGWFTSSLIFWPFVLLVFVTFGLMLFYILKVSHMNRLLEQVWATQQRSAGAANRGAAMQPLKNPAVDNLTQQLKQQEQGLSQFTAQLNQFQSHLAERDRQVADALQSVALTANWLGQFQLRQSASSDGANLNESERASAINILSRYQEPLRLNASRVDPLAVAMANLVEKLEVQPQLASELSRAQSLSEEIEQFGLWNEEVNEELNSLRRGSFTSRSSKFQEEQQRLIAQVKAGAMSVAQMVEHSRSLLEQQLPRNSQSSSSIPVTSEYEAELKQRIASAPESLMNWFDNFFQLHAHLSSTPTAASDSGLVNALAQVQRSAREVLSKFDIQPEEIQAGRTAYDRRLHEASLVRHSAQVPINTVIEVLRCGFRRVSTGEVLRRPQVVVAGATAG